MLNATKKVTIAHVISHSYGHLMLDKPYRTIRPIRQPFSWHQENGLFSGSNIHFLCFFFIGINYRLLANYDKDTPVQYQYYHCPM